MISNTSWELWSSDMFDRDAEPSCEARGAGYEAGLAALWRKTLEEGVLDDGRPTFTAFSLRTAGRPNFTLPRDPLMNAELGKLRQWRNEAGLLEALARALALGPDDALRVIFDAINASVDGAELRRQLP